VLVQKCYGREFETMSEKGPRERLRLLRLDCDERLSQCLEGTRGVIDKN